MISNVNVKIKIDLKELTLLDVNKTYKDWMNDFEIFRFSKQSNEKHTIKKIKEFVSKKKKFEE